MRDGNERVCVVADRGDEDVVGRVEDAKLPDAGEGVDLLEEGERGGVDGYGALLEVCGRHVVQELGGAERDEVPRVPVEVKVLGVAAEGDTSAGGDAPVNGVQG